MRFLLCLLIIIVIFGVSYAQPTVIQPVREGNMERLVLDDGVEAEAAAWAVAEATVTVDKKHARRGDTALRFHIEVNWETGEKNYPIGWPRMSRDWPEAVQNWRAYDFLEFSIFAESSRPQLPNEPLGLILKGAQKQNIFTRSLSELRLGEWTDYRIPLADIIGAETMTGIQFYISESNYKHGDVLDFWIDHISLVRYVEPSLASSCVPERALFADAGYVAVDLSVLGLIEDQQAEISWELRLRGRSVAAGKLKSSRGKSRVYVPLPLNLEAGNYELGLKIGQEALFFPVKLIFSPWQEAAK